MIDTHYLSECDAESALVQYLQVECTLLIDTDGGSDIRADVSSTQAMDPDSL